MRGALLGALVGAGLVVAASSLSGQTRGMAPARSFHAAVGPEQGLIALASPAADGGQLVTVIDPRLRSMAVYRVDAAGRIRLTSVRNIQWDLQLMELNSESPLPQEIRSLLEQR